MKESSIRVGTGNKKRAKKVMQAAYSELGLSCKRGAEHDPFGQPY